MLQIDSQSNSSFGGLANCRSINSSISESDSSTVSCITPVCGPRFVSQAFARSFSFSSSSRNSSRASYSQQEHDPPLGTLHLPYSTDHPPPPRPLLHCTDEQSIGHIAASHPRRCIAGRSHAQLDRSTDDPCGPLQHIDPPSARPGWIRALLVP